MLRPSPNESPQAFGYDVGPVFWRKELLNADDLPELEGVEFFAIAYLSFFDLDRYLHAPGWADVRPLLSGEGKMLGYNARREKPAPHPLTPLWQYALPNLAGSWKVPSWGLWVHAHGAWLGNRDGAIAAVDGQGILTNQHQLPKTARCMVGDDRHLYASCDDGQIYDLTGKVPTPVYNLRPASRRSDYSYVLMALELRDGDLFVADACGQLTCLNAQLDVLWQQPSEARRAWFLRADDEAVYCGHDRGVTCCDRETGKVRWQHPLPGVLCGDLAEDWLVVGTVTGELHRLAKYGDVTAQQTEGECILRLDNALYACCLWDARHAILAADLQANLYAVSQDGDCAPWSMPLNCGAPLTLRVGHDRLYATTTDGTLACFDCAAIGAGTAELPAPLPPPATPRPTPPTASTDWILVECFKQGSKVKERPQTPGYRADWNVQFPQHLRQVGMRYWVEGLQEAKQGGFYRVVGQILPEDGRSTP